MGALKTDLIITCDHLFDGRRLVEDAVVVIDGERIAAVHTNGAGAGVADAQAADGAERRHARFLMPGLIDCHAHLFGHAQSPPIGAPFALVKNFMRLLACNGVTSVRDAGNAIETVRFCQDWSARQDGPRVFPTGPLLDAPPLMWPFSRIVRDPQAARQEVERLKVEGLEWVSLYHNVTLEVAKAAIEAAHAHGMAVAADVHRIATQDVLEAGVTSLEHAHNLLHAGQKNGNGTADTAADRMLRWSGVDLHAEAITRLTQTLLEQKTFLCPTLLVTHRWCSIEEMVGEPNLEYMVAVMPHTRNFLRMRQPMGMVIGKRVLQQHLPVPHLSRSQRVEVQKGLHTLKAIVAQLHEAGVPIVVGTDAPSPSVVPGFSMHQEMALLVEGGMTPVSVLAAATAEAARLLRREDDLGCIKPGALADVLVIDGNPAARITDSKKIQTVFKAGRPIDRKGMLDALRPHMEGV